MEKCAGAPSHINHMSLWMGSATVCNKLARTYSKKIRYIEAGQTVWQNVRTYQVITKVTCSDVHEKFLLVLTRNSTEGIAVRPKDPEKGSWLTTQNVSQCCPQKIATLYVVIWFFMYFRICFLQLWAIVPFLIAESVLHWILNNFDVSRPVFIGALVRLNMLTAHVDNAFSAEFCLITI